MDDLTIIQPSEMRGMIFEFDVPAIRAEMVRLLSIPKCANFVKQVLAFVSEKAAPVRTLVAGGDVLEIFDTITKKPHGLVRAGDAAHGAIGGANFAHGSMERGDAWIQVGNVFHGAAITFAELKDKYVKSDARVCIHESMHHAGNFVYSDEEMARAVSALKGIPLPTPKPNEDSRLVYSWYWDDELVKTFKG